MCTCEYLVAQYNYLYLVTKMEARKLCLLHDKELLPLICKDCTVPVCCECLTSSHNRHTITGITDTVFQHRELLQSALIKDETSSHLEALRITVNESLANIVSDSEKAEEDINLETNRIIEEAEQYRRHQLEKIAEMKRKHEVPLHHLNMQIKQFKEYLDQTQCKENPPSFDDLTDMDTVVLSLDLSRIIRIPENDTKITNCSFGLTATMSLHIAENGVGSAVEEHALMSDSDAGAEKEIREKKEKEDDGDDLFLDCPGIPQVLTSSAMFNGKMTSITPRSSHCSVVLSDAKMYEVNRTEDMNKTKKDEALLSNVKQVFRAPDGNIYILLTTENEWCIKKLLPDNRIIPFCQLGYSHDVCIGLRLNHDIAALMILQTKSKRDGKLCSRVLLVLDENGMVKSNTASGQTY